MRFLNQPKTQSMSEKISVNVISDDMLEPYFLLAEKGKIQACKKKIRKKKDGSTETVTSVISTSTSIPSALKAMIEDAFSYKSKAILTTGEYIKAYKEIKERFKQKFLIEENDYI